MQLIENSFISPLPPSLAMWMCVLVGESAYGKLYLIDLVYLFNSVFIVLLKHT